MGGGGADIHVHRLHRKAKGELRIDQRRGVGVGVGGSVIIYKTEPESSTTHLAWATVAFATKAMFGKKRSVSVT